MYGPLLRSRIDRKVAGVCAAFARSYGWDVTVTRIAVLVIALTTGFGFIAYLVCWVAIPEEPFGAPYPQTYGYPPPPQGYYPPQGQPVPPYGTQAQPGAAPSYPPEGPRETPPSV